MFLSDMCARNFSDHFGELIDSNHSILPQIKWMWIFRAHELVNSLYTIIDVTKGASLFAVPPNLNFTVASQLRDSDLPAHGGRRLFPSAIPCSQWSEDVMKPHDPGLDAVILAVMRTQPLGNELLPSIGVLGLRRIGVFFL